jgi:hypothetical protein
MLTSVLFLSPGSAEDQAKQLVLGPGASPALSSKSKDTDAASSVTREVKWFKSASVTWFWESDRTPVRLWRSVYMMAGQRRGYWLFDG